MIGSEGISETLPAGWINSSIGNVAEFVRGVTYQKSDAKNQMEDGYIPLIRATNISNESITYDEFVFVPRNVVKSEQLIRMNDMVLAASSGSISVVGKSAPVLINYEATFGAFCAVLRPVGEVLPGYFRLFVQSPIVRETWSNLARGTNINNLKREQVLSTSFPIAPIAEQEKIVEILEEQLSRLDAALSSVRAVREKSARFRRSILYTAFTGGLIGHNTSDGTLPVGWKRKTIAQVAEVVAGRTPTKFEQRLAGSTVENRNVPFYKVGDMNSAAQYLKEARVYFAEHESGSFGIEILPAGTVIFPKAGGAIATNKKRVLEVAGAIDLNCMGVSSNGALLPQLLYWFFESFNLSSIADGSVLPQIGKKKVSSIEICYPESEFEQQKLLKDIEASVSRSDAVDRMSEAIEQKAAAFRRSLLHAAFSGDLTKEWREGAHV